MSQQQELWNVVGRAKLDRDFASRLFQDTPGTLKAEGLTVSPEEVHAALAGQSPPLVGLPWSPQQPPPQQGAAPAAAQQDELSRMVLHAQGERMIDLGKFTVQTLKDTIQHATGTYKKINVMNQTMFWMGIGLFLFAVGYAVYSHNLTYSIAFAGLGTISFIGTFILGPLGATQGALSDLISAEIAFMSYFEQIFLIEGLARIPDGSNGQFDPARVERASELMQLRSVQTADLLHRYLNKADRAIADDANKTASGTSVAADATRAALGQF
jgi:hypothetical protein